MSLEIDVHCTGHSLQNSTIQAWDIFGRKVPFRHGTFSERNDLDATIGAMEEILGLNGNNLGTESEEKRLATQINAVAVLDMIRNLQDEIKVSDFK